MIEIAGYTVDGKPVVRGLYQFRATYGMPIDVLLERCRKHNIVPDWLYLFQETHKQGELRQAIIDVYGRDYLNGITEKTT